ncbi:MAG: hypothetical protein LIP02_08525 [Bacteroidales bacterium]|nr:hypothetical protein [Bacteroidales bacterium]
MKRLLRIVAFVAVGITYGTPGYAQEAATMIEDSIKRELTPKPEVMSPKEDAFEAGTTVYEHLGPFTGATLTISPALFSTRSHASWLDNLSGYTTRQSMPGLMGVEAGAIQYNLNLGRSHFIPEGFVNRYGWFRGVTTQYGIGATMSFDISRAFSVTIFGSYASNAWTDNPAVLSNMATSRYGGFLTWNIDDHWGIDVGAQRVRNGMYGGNWETVPIFMPYYKLGKAKLGIDAGGILHQLFRDSRGYRPNPTIGPPVDTSIRIRPRD